MPTQAPLAPGSSTSPALPADAPFDESQKPFVEGFLSGLASVASAHKAASQPQAPGTALAVLYGSQSGNAEALSKKIRKKGRASGFDPKVGDLDSFDRATLADTELVLILTSTFGEGDPPDNAKQFYDWILSDEAPSLEGVNYAVLALGDRSYTHFCKSGIDIDNRMVELGATRICERVDCDVDLDDDFAAWTESVFTSGIMQEAAAEVGAIIEDDDETDGPGVYTKNNPFYATVLDAYTLNKPGSGKEINHIELSLAGGGESVAYDVGDALGLWPTNCPELVKEVIDTAGLSGREVVQIGSDFYPIRTALIKKLDLNTMTAKGCEAMGVWVDDNDLPKLHLVDLLKTYKPKLDAQSLVDGLRALQPRLYSISSSPKAHPGEVHLTVGAVRYDLNDSPRKGVASTCLSDRLPIGSTVGVYMQKAAHFHLPTDPNTPVIMCGPGTGIAPFRAFLEDRASDDAPGDNWLFFGDQKSEFDFIYQEQLEGYVNSGLLTKLSLAWSRDQGSKVYVQNLMLSTGAEIWQWFERGACFYICGDASRMAKDVNTALEQIATEHGGVDGVEYVKQLIADGRYQRDVY